MAFFKKRPFSLLKKGSKVKKYNVSKIFLELFDLVKGKCKNLLFLFSFELK